MKTIMSFSLLLVCSVVLFSSDNPSIKSPSDRPISPGAWCLVPENELSKSASMEKMSTAVNKLIRGFNGLREEQTEFFKKVVTAEKQLVALEAACNARFEKRQQEHTEQFEALNTKLDKILRILEPKIAAVVVHAETSKIPKAKKTAKKSTSVKKKE